MDWCGTWTEGAAAKQGLKPQLMISEAWSPGISEGSRQQRLHRPLQRGHIPVWLPSCFCVPMGYDSCRTLFWQLAATQWHTLSVLPFLLVCSVIGYL